MSEKNNKPVRTITVNGVKHDIEDVEAVAAEQERAQGAEALLGEELGRETSARTTADNDIRSKAAMFGTFAPSAETDRVSVGYQNLGAAQGTFILPAATTAKAGVMSASDKVQLIGNTSSIGGINNSINAISDALSDESTARQKADTELTDNQVRLWGVSASADGVNLLGKNNNGANVHSIDIPSATTGKAGVMSAEDKTVLRELQRRQDQTQTQINNIKPIQITDSNIVNAPDEEDITMQDNVLKLKDRSFGNGMGYVILRKNKTFKEQLTQSNTIYEIRYDFDLGGDMDFPIPIPENCTLKFEGGKLFNGLLKGSSAIIQSEHKCFSKCLLTGQWDIVGQAHWFADTAESDVSTDLQYLLDSAFNSIYFRGGTYNIKQSLFIRYSKYIVLQSGEEGGLRATIKTNEDIPLIQLVGPDPESQQSPQSQRISIIGGCIDASSYPGYSNSAIIVDLSKPNNMIWGLEIKTTIIGSRADTWNNQLLKGKGIEFITSTDTNIGSYATMIRIDSIIHSFRVGVDVQSVAGASWITDVKIGGEFLYCATAAILSAERSEFYASVQSANLFFNNDHLPMLEVHGRYVNINGIFWDTSINAYCHKHAILLHDDTSSIYLGDNCLGLLTHNSAAGDTDSTANGNRALVGKLSAIINADYTKYTNLLDNGDKYNFVGSAVCNFLEGIDKRIVAPENKEGITIKYYNENDEVEDVLDIPSPDNMFHIDKPQTLIKWKTTPSDITTGYIAIDIPIEQDAFFQYAYPINDCMLRLNNAIQCKRVTFIRTFINGNIRKDSVAFQSLVSGKTYENLHSACNIATPVSHLQIRLEQLSEANAISIYYIAGYGVQPAGTSIPVTFVPIGGGRMCGDLQLPNLVADSVSVDDFKIAKRNNALLAYNNRCIQPITLGIIEQEYAQPGQMFFYKSKQVPVWRKEGEYNAERPYDLYVDALGNAYDTKYTGNTNDRPNNVKQGFQYFDTTLKKPIWWTGTVWVDCNGSEV